MTYPLLSRIEQPADIRHLSKTELKQLATELRDYLLHSVSRTGGHLSSNLGTVELTIALHHVFNTPHDRLVWDVGHQTYPHKILTGRRDRMPTLRQFGGMSGFPRRDESEYDTFGTAHSSTSISAALGMAQGAQIRGESRRAVAIIGDGAMTAGMAFEALNNAGVPHAGKMPNVLVVLNDNDMSISPPVGALNRYLARLMSGRFYAAARESAKQVLRNAPPLFELAKKLEEHAKGMVVPATIFEEFGFNYVGPIDGHDLDSLIPTLENLRDRVLKVVARHLKTALGDKAVVARHGGEEFACLFPGMAIDGARPLLEGMREGLEMRSFVNSETGTSIGCITVSIGLAPLESDPRAAMRAADAALYAAKRAGKNRVIVAQPGEPDG